MWVKIAQGMDPFDKNTWHRCKVYSDLRWLEEIGDIQEDKQREWTGARERTSLIRLAPDTPAGTTIPVLLDNESWSFHYTPTCATAHNPSIRRFSSTPATSTATSSAWGRRIRQVQIEPSRRDRENTPLTRLKPDRRDQA